MRTKIAVCLCCADTIFETDPDLSREHGSTVWSHTNNTKCDDPTPNKNNYYVSPFIDFMVSGWAKRWLEEKVYMGSNPLQNKDYPWDENDSYSWVVLAAKQLIAQIEGNLDAVLERGDK